MSHEHHPNHRGGFTEERLAWLFSLCLAACLAACSSNTSVTGRYKIALTPDLRGQYGIFTINSDQTAGRLVIPEASAQLRTSSWSPDGKKIAFFATRTQDSSMMRKYQIPLHFPLYVINAGGGEPKRVLDFPVSSFEFSPDGQQILFTSAHEDPARDDGDVVRGLKSPMCAVYILNLQNGKHRRVTGFGQHCSGTWSPDGKRLALTLGDTAQRSDLYTASLDGRQTRRLTDSPGIKIRPSWSPGDNQIAFITFVSQPEGMTSSAHVIHADGSNMKTLPKANPYEVFWLPDGKSLLLRFTNGFALVSIDGNTILDMNDKVFKPQDAVPTPDGREIMFRSNHEGPWYVYTVGIHGGEPKRISGNLSASSFCVSPLR